MKKRVVIDASSCLIGSWNPYLSGVGRTTLELIRALEAKKTLPFELVLFCQRFKRDRLQRYHFKSPQYCLPFPRNKWINWTKNIFPVVETLTGADLYHIPHNCGEFFNGRKTILTIHDAMMFAIPDDYHFTKQEQEQQKRKAEKCSGILTCSQSSKRLLLNYINIPEDKITVVPWGYDTSTFRKYDADFVKEELQKKFQLVHPYLLTVSCSTGRKRTPELIRQYLKCAEKEYPFDLVIVWKNIPQELLSQINLHPQKNRIKILRGVSDQDLAMLYSGSVCTVFPSLHEGFGLPILESMACGTPVLTSNQTAMPEIAGDAGIYLETSEEDEISEKLIALAGNKYNLDIFSKRSLLQAKKFSWENCASQTIEVYEKYLN